MKANPIKLNASRSSEEAIGRAKAKSDPAPSSQALVGSK